MTDFQVKATSHAELSFRSLQSLSILLGRGGHCVGDSNKVPTSHITCTHVQGLMVSIVLGMRGQWHHKMYCVWYARSMATYYVLCWVCAVNGKIRCIVLGMRGQCQHDMYC